jgi:MOSC domain-containing protein YiiM
MWKGSVVSIHIAADARGSMTSLQQVTAIAGRGLEGDRYFNEKGTFSKKPGPDREVTLIEIEAIEALKRDYGADLDPGQSRRNIVTRGVPLNHLVGRQFKVGEVMLRGIRLCEPCDHLAHLSGREVVPGLIHRGGLRAEILTTGAIRPCDPVELL